MRIYLSAQWSRRDEIEGYAAVLRDYGFEVVSTWHAGEPFGDDKTTQEDHWIEWANSDLTEVDQCDTFLAFTEPQGTQSRGGRHVEWGYAQANDLRECIIIGPIESQFYALRDDGFADFADYLAGMNLPELASA